MHVFFHKIIRKNYIHRFFPRGILSRRHAIVVCNPGCYSNLHLHLFLLAPDGTLTALWHEILAKKNKWRGCAIGPKYIFPEKNIVCLVGWGKGKADLSTFLRTGSTTEPTESQLQFPPFSFATVWNSPPPSKWEKTIFLRQDGGQREDNPGLRRAQLRPGHTQPAGAGAEVILQENGHFVRQKTTWKYWL